MSYAALLFTLLLLLEIVTARWIGPVFGDSTLMFIFAALWVVAAVGVFGSVVVGAIWVHTATYQLAAGRFIRDIGISAALTIAAFAVLYRYNGLSSGGATNTLCFAETTCTCDAGPVDQLYFSIVTFTTLGFGDFVPCSARLVAAFEALLGTLHLGLFAGGVFYYLNETKGSEEDG